METTFLLTSQDVVKEVPVTLVSPVHPTPTEVVFLSNIDQTVAFPVETIFFYEAPHGDATITSDITERVRRSVSDVLLIHYYFMAGRLNLNVKTKRLELVCNNAGVLYVGAKSNLSLKELGNLSLPNPSFQHLILRTDSFKSLADTPIFTIQVTKFRCGGFSIGFVTNHSVLDGRSAAEMMQNLASVCKGEGMKTYNFNLDRSCIKARDPPQIKFIHAEYSKPAESTITSFTSPNQPSPPPSLLTLSKNHDFRLFPFSSMMIDRLKENASMKCSSFEAIVAHIWRARTKAIFDDSNEISSVLFAVDIRSKMQPPLPNGYMGNAVISASASARVFDIDNKPFSFCVEKVREGIERVTDEYVRSVIDWLEVHKGVPSTANGSFYVSAWWKLPFHELDFGYGKPSYGGPVVSGMDEFVLLLSDGKDMGKGGGINTWVVLERSKMANFSCYVSEL
ncbi:uncharacterized protein A4U43_C02F5820 [Asparagus officinalis]|uniref:Omega-hydroxypalmitate O-feruloyl transferase n=1 Tax=Asparagus officinalis TaxID=4686 RepID=A0A5P1FLA4_ASPOF|nr:omega-hydroxypalmitate O-feruloyl transferase-like [Asparagus officinalis]ONK77370.1 uncharacterized protein A4U43_C02F5820 [Asparagus officinalis]